MDRAINIKIDGKEIEAVQRQSLIEVAKENGIYIPTLCYFKKIFPPTASCRVCTVKVNGRLEAGCTIKVQQGMDIEVHTEELVDYRKAIIEMLFAEGNHYCPSCSKSGFCDLQFKGYELGLTVTRFPHLFEDRPMDFEPERLVMVHNRCILCSRCVEEVKTSEGERVFHFQNRGHGTRVGIDYENEAKLTEEQAERAMKICPVGAILHKGKVGGKPFGVRKYDFNLDIKSIPMEEIDTPKKTEGKKIVATTSLAGCFGCHMSILDIDTELVDLLEFVEFNKSPLTDIKKFTKRCDVGIIEGGVANSENFEVLKAFRENCDVLIALGECSIWGGMPAMRNVLSIEECLEEAYLNSSTSEKGAHLIPYNEDIPKMLDKVHACNDVVKIDYFIPGCPPNANHIWKVVKNVLFDANIPIDYAEFKYD